MYKEKKLWKKGKEGVEESGVLRTQGKKEWPRNRKKETEGGQRET